MTYLLIKAAGYILTRKSNIVAQVHYLKILNIYSLYSKWLKDIRVFLLKRPLFLTISPISPLLKSPSLGSLFSFAVLIFNLRAFNNFYHSSKDLINFRVFIVSSSSYIFYQVSWPFYQISYFVLIRSVLYGQFFYQRLP